MSREIPLLAYFFPHDENDPHRVTRTTALGVKTQSDLKLTNNRYCLGDPNFNYWVDSDPSAIAAQMTLAQEAGVGFIVDTYVGFSNGARVEEFRRPLDLISQQSREHDVMIANMFCLKLPRAVIPFDPGIDEPNRWLDINKDTAHAIVDRAAGLWEQPNYLFFDNRPYLSLYGILNNQTCTREAKVEFIDYIREYALKTYGANPLMFGVGQTPQDVLMLRELGFDASTQYAGLADFETVPPMQGAEQFQISSEALDVQFADEQLELATSRWLAIASLGYANFYPSVSVGWDASARGTSKEGKGYPSSPIIVDTDVDTLQKGLVKLWTYFNYFKEIPYPHFPIFAWNEVAENGALLPKIKENGSLDMSCLNLIRSFNHLLREVSGR